ncbi:hypothetical protein BV25DRAFT_1886644 [Artomyces pyxidatus]|uniref:Uncharacterized protein n=1 Tax=Artomyces pyxidatus TaxID=48021 RepID=A0ACB8SZW1_9AGAM|nr:hypothetical protein BV25DRAFT_1886644 [Artomyces pyxidatus]
MDSHRVSNQPSSKRLAIYLTIAAVASIIFVLTFWQSGVTVYKAVAVLSGDSPVSGTVTFEQSSKSGVVTVTGDLRGLDPSAKRGFHIHQLGDASNGCLSAGPHFNPFNKNHGAPGDAERHVGDLGNIKSDALGAARFTVQDEHLTLNGPRSIVGRSVVLHAGTDDLGKGGNAESLKTGNAGARAACGVIGVAELH